MPPNRALWRSVVLRPMIVALLLFSEVSLVGGIIGLWVLSDVHKGFIKVGSRGSASAIFSMQGALDRGQPLLWTTLPTFIFTLYRPFREAVVTALVIETPFIELYKSSSERPTEVRKSIYVDYRTSFSIVAWYKALRNSHTFLGLCILFSFVVSIALVPLAGGLFTEGGEFHATHSAINLLSTFDPTIDISIVDYGRLFDIVSASWIHDAPYPAGTEGHFALPRIRTAQDLHNYTISLLATTSQLSLDCQVVRDAVFTTKAETTNIALEAFSAVDRDCAISGDVAVGYTFPSYLKALSEQNCPDVAGRTRVVLFYISPSLSGDVQDPTLVSCIPSYWIVNGTVSVSGSTGFTGRLIEMPSFSETTREIKELPDLKRQQFEQAVINVQTINIGSKVNTPNRLAELAARYIDSKGLDFTEKSLIEAASTVYAAIYTMLCIDQFYPSLANSIQQEGILQIPENRLHVVKPVAIAMLIILAILIVETVYLIIYLSSHPSILAEEPIGLVGAANLLHDSNISCLVAKFHHEPGFDGRLRRSVTQASMSWWKKIPKTDDSLSRRECWVERDPTSKRLSIVVKSTAMDAECPQPFHEHTVSAYERISAPHAAHTPWLATGQQTMNAAPSVWSGSPPSTYANEGRDDFPEAFPALHDATARQRPPPHGGRQPQTRETRNNDIDMGNAPQLNNQQHSSGPLVAHPDSPSCQTHHDQASEEDHTSIVHSIQINPSSESFGDAAWQQGRYPGP
ncbi:hypothetical protein DL95DRAFT_459003 [Leptodontidium sp. 2 PMI_412]|nr:hypothetical protein DL95DRAFT_459003 [Leptodontidium sp. 2 PMI_412]